MPLTESVSFTTTLESQNKIQIPKLIRWRFKIESDQALKVGVYFLGAPTGMQVFYTKMRKDGRITVPKFVLSLMQGEEGKSASSPIDVMIEPA
jgi:bifunctional DNA-binding transcriptional regulator/antitoxin component of YhaV-PrlF toxin-antitoxin module